MIRITPRDFAADFAKADPKQIVRNWEPLTNDKRFTQDGVFSEKIFGNMSNSVEYSCECGHLQGEFNIGTKCSACQSEVIFKGLQLSREGWIDLRYPIIHPVFYRYFKKIIGPTVLNNILNFKARIRGNGDLLEPPLEPPFAGIGMTRFIDNYAMILDHFMEKKKDAVKEARMADCEFLAEYEELLFVSQFPIINARLRPAIMIGEEFSFDAISNLYNQIIRNSETIGGLTELEMNDANALTLVYRNQMLVNEVFDKILDNLSNKEGFIRGSLVGNRMNLTARNVIGPLPGNYGMDQCALPYHTALELMKPMILRKIMKVKRTSIAEAHRAWFRASRGYNRFVHTIMRDIAKSGQVKVLLNRNPTISVGSILMLDIADVKEDPSDFTLNISNLILPCLAGDYDGDVLNILLLVSEKFTNLFSRFRPSNLVIDCDSGKFNRNFAPFKDIQVGLQTILS